MIKCISLIICIAAIFISGPVATKAQKTSLNAMTTEEVEIIIIRKIFSEQDLSMIPRIRITSSFVDSKNDMFYAYFQQYYEGMEVYKAIGNVAIGNGHEILKYNRLILDESKFGEISEALDPENAVRLVASYLGLPFRNSKGSLIKRKDNNYSISNLPFAREAVNVKLVWALRPSGKLEKTWVVELVPSVTSDHWEILIDASTGAVIDEFNNTVYCSSNKNMERHRFDETKLSKGIFTKPISKPLNKKNDGAQYRVFAPPLESPNQGEHTLESESSDPIASPFGWHDTDGVTGPEFTILRGNNVHAYQDTADANIPGIEETPATSGLIFDYQFDQQASPEANLDADLTNLFYWNNYMHDWSYQFGFNESSGNFQQNNYNKGGRDGDYIFAETLDGSDTNNANFSGPRDGTNGRMQMYKWVVGNDFEILEPEDLSGLYNTGNASFGPVLSEALIQKIVLVNDGIGDIRDACDSIVNGEELAGNIALIDRGTCDFSFKVHAAQEVGAVACLVCNNLDNSNLVNMAAGENADLVRIPSLFLSKEDCAIIKSRLQEEVTGRFNETREVSSGFDNGIIVHEYAHGISMRLVGGALTAGCLSNDEQIGEGLSDFIALVNTQLPQDEDATPRGVGTYVNGEPRSGRGIRRYPYSTDFIINPQVHSHVRASTRPHDVGEIWAGVLWDMYWAFIERDGYDATWQDENSGNFKAVQLVFDALKIQVCDAGLIDAREAIFDADVLNNSGTNECLLWPVFARRGLGVNARQGDPDSRYDNFDNFDIPPVCTQELSIRKEMTPLISPRHVIDVVLTLNNYKEDLPDVIVTDQIPEGTEILVSSPNDNLTIDGNNMTFNIGDLNNGDSRQIKYSLLASNIQPAAFEIYDEMEGAVQFERTTSNEDLRGWALTTSQSFSGIFSLKVASDTIGGESYAVRNGSFIIDENNRLLGFDHLYDTQLGIDGGTIEISLDQGENWQVIDPQSYLVNPLTDQITFDIFYSNTLPAFTGTNGWQSTVVDLGEFMGQEVKIRFRYVSLRFREPIEALGWLIDDFELFERKELGGEACMFSSGTQVACDYDFSLINSEAKIDPVTEIINEDLSFSISPNPASNFLDINLILKNRFTGLQRIIAIDGKELYRKEINLPAGENQWTEEISALSPGMYFLELIDRTERYTVAFVKQ